MVDAVTTQILVDDTRRAVFKFTNISDGTGETGVVKIDVSALDPYQGKPCTSVAIQTLDAITSGMGVNMLWDATTDVICLTLGENDFVSFNFSRFGGLTNNAGLGKTGDLLFTTIGAASGDRYTIVMEVQKYYG
jgi:hypothetical protein